MIYPLGLWVLIGSVIIGGIALVVLARFARRENQRLARGGIVNWRDVVASRPATWTQRLALEYFGPQPKWVECVARTLAIIAVLFVAAVVLGFIALIVMNEAR